MRIIVYNGMKTILSLTRLNILANENVSQLERGCSEKP